NSVQNPPRPANVMAVSKRSVSAGSHARGNGVDWTIAFRKAGQELRSSGLKHAASNPNRVAAATNHITRSIRRYVRFWVSNANAKIAMIVTAQNRLRPLSPRAGQLTSFAMAVPPAEANAPNHRNEIAMR